MASPQESQLARSESPDPASLASNIYDTSGTEGEWEEETDDDDMDFEPSTDESEEAEFFDPSEDPEAEFHGSLPSLPSVHSTAATWMRGIVEHTH